MNERTGIHNKKRIRHRNDMHVQDMQSIHDGHDSKIKDKCYEIEEY